MATRFEEYQQELKNRIQPYLQRLEPARAWWEQQRPEDQNRYILISGAVSFVLVILIVFSAASNLRNLRESISKMRSTSIARIDVLSEEYDQLKREVGRLKTRGMTEKLSTFVEHKAREVQVVDQMDLQDKKSEPGDLFDESVVKVTFKKISLQQLTQFMHAIESSGKAARIQNIESAKPNFGDKNQLDVSLEVVGYTAKS